MATIQVNRIGNFTLLAGAPHIIASNNPFVAKLNEYEKSNIPLTKNICIDYADRRFDFGAVEERSESFQRSRFKSGLIE